MVKELKQFGDAIDRSGVAGWMLLLSGFFIVAVTVLAPAWMDLKRIEAEVAVLDRQQQTLEMRHINTQAFVRAVERDDPILMQRLVWHHLNLKPEGAEPVELSITQESRPSPPPIEQWVRPNLGPVDGAAAAVAPYPDSRLVRLTTGPTRAWTLAFGGWLILLGLLINPSPSAGAVAADEEGDEGEGNDGATSSTAPAVS
jgi:hypothetical protein